MEIVNFGKQGFANRFCRELADSIANLRVWAQGSKPKACPLPATRGLTPLGSADSPGPFVLCPSVVSVLIQSSTGWVPLSLLAMSKCSICPYPVGLSSPKPFGYD